MTIWQNGDQYRLHGVIRDRYKILVTSHSDEDHFILIPSVDGLEYCLGAACLPVVRHIGLYP